MSGPAGGVVGYAATTYHHQPDMASSDTGQQSTEDTTFDSSFKDISQDERTNVSPVQKGKQLPAKGVKLPVIGFDMGGTSTDVSRYAGVYEHVFESTTAGITVQAPQVSVLTLHS